MEATAITFTAPHTVELTAVDVDPPGPNELLVETELSAISAGTERLIYTGNVSQDLQADENLDALDGGLQYPLRYGYSAVGEVISVGSAVADSWIGKRVFAFHPHQTRFCCDVDDAVALDTLNLETAIFIPFMETAFTFALDAQPRVCERIVVHGAGVIGLSTIYLLSQFPLETLHVIEPIESRRKLALDLGATTASETIIESSSFDTAIEVSGDPDAFQDALHAVGFDGSVIVGSWYGNRDVSANLGGRFHRDRVDIVSSQVSTIDPAVSGRWDRTRRLTGVTEMLESFDPGPLITDRIPFEAGFEAYELLDGSPTDTLQILLTYT